MVNGINPIADPIGFIASFFLYGIATFDLSAFLKIALLGSLLVFPFALLGDYIFRKTKSRINPFLKMFLINFFIVIVFFLVLGLWRTVFGYAFFSFSALGQHIVLGTVFSFPLVLLCNYLKKRIGQWKIPEKLNIYLQCLFGSIIASFILWLIFIILWVFG
jgi:hypothetical protein